MIDFFSETDFDLSKPDVITAWILETIINEKHELGEVSFIFCDDAYLHRLNIQFLDHDTLTDVISFDNSLGIQIHGEIYISIERVRENARAFSESFNEELHRVMIHGILHFCGYKDKTTEEERLMRDKENNALELLGKR
jgi:rRNA maturation RNase YbeY